jgi:hypothetical protein
LADIDASNGFLLRETKLLDFDNPQAVLWPPPQLSGRPVLTWAQAREAADLEARQRFAEENRRALEAHWGQQEAWKENRRREELAEIEQERRHQIAEVLRGRL